MKVKDLVEGHLYNIIDDDRVCIILARGNWIDLLKTRYTIKWSKDKLSLKGQPAIYCGKVKKNTSYFKQGFYKAHKFLISGEYFYCHGTSIRNFEELKLNE